MRFSMSRHGGRPRIPQLYGDQGSTSQEGGPPGAFGPFNARIPLHTSARTPIGPLLLLMRGERREGGERGAPFRGSALPRLQNLVGVSYRQSYEGGGGSPISSSVVLVVE